MRSCLLLVLCAAGAASMLVQHRNISDTTAPVERKNERSQYVKRFACPVGFFRLKGFCYYLSAGTATWSDANFHCKDRNATLAILDKPGKDRVLRRYLSGDQFTKLERWIGGIFNWQQTQWVWGVIGEKIGYQNFEEPSSEKSENRDFSWHCIILNPKSGYKWSARGCIDRKHYVCQVPAGRIRRRQRKIHEPRELQNQRLPKPRQGGGEGHSNGSRKISGKKRKRLRGGGKRYWKEGNPDESWAHGVNLGSRPPPFTAGRRKYRARNNATATSAPDYHPMVAQILPQERYTFLSTQHREVQRLSESSDTARILSPFDSKPNALVREEVLFKP